VLVHFAHQRVLAGLVVPVGPAVLVVLVLPVELHLAAGVVVVVLHSYA
jgi:hypothetical protein